MSYAHLNTTEQQRLLVAAAAAHRVPLSGVRPIVEELSVSPEASRWAPIVTELERAHGEAQAREIWDKLMDRSPILPPEDTRAP
jgi:hypothetical protein